MSRRASLWALAAASLAILTAAADPERVATERDLRNTEQALGQAEATQRQNQAGLTAMQAELQVLSAAMQGAVADLREHERTIVAINESLHQLEAQRNQRQAELESRREQAGSVLSALVRLTALPPEAALVGRGVSDDRLRTALLMRGLSPRLQERAALLAGDIKGIRKAEGSIAAEQKRLAAAKVDLERRYRALAQVVEQKDKLLSEQAATADRTAAIAQRLAKSAASLREFLGRIDIERATRSAAVSAERQRRSAIAAARGLPVPSIEAPPFRLAGLDGQQGGLISPVNGQLVYGFGEGEGRFTEGVTIAVAVDTPVLSPADGRVVYAGPFRDYGILLIVEHGGGFHSVLTGLGLSEMVAGQWVLAGEPLGLTASHGSLYIEIRQGGRPVDPLAWFTVDRS
jgi:murein hydrolase activator